MARPAEPESFEVTEYSGEERLDKMHSVLSEIVQDRVSKHPNANVRVGFTGNLMKLSYHCFELHLPTRIRQIESDKDTVLKEMVKVLKKEYKSRTGDSLSIKERKDMENYSVQKVSLNERYMYVGWRFFELG